MVCKGLCSNLGTHLPLRQKLLSGADCVSVDVQKHGCDVCAHALCETESGMQALRAWTLVQLLFSAPHLIYRHQMSALNHQHAHARSECARYLSV